MAEEQATDGTSTKENDHVAVDIDDSDNIMETPSEKKLASFSATVKGSVSRAREYVQRRMSSRVASFSDRYDDIYYIEQSQTLVDGPMEFY